MFNSIYHYTHLDAAQQILDDRYLKVSQWEIDNNVEHPALWLSLHPHWESTATKMVVNEKGSPHQLSFEEQWTSIGCVRFVMPFEQMQIISWDQYKVIMQNDPQGLLEAMEQVGLQCGADPTNWYASLEDISLEKVIACQIWTGLEWMDIELNEEMMNHKNNVA